FCLIWQDIRIIFFELYAFYSLSNFNRHKPHFPTSISHSKFTTDNQSVTLSLFQPNEIKKESDEIKKEFSETKIRSQRFFQSVFCYLCHTNAYLKTYT
ncbi:MAG: hypothetical protein UHN41_00500, partial [Bacteroidales bacterium]|nr:hypothetical protein [Bacteroidales bacterium]